MALAIASPIKAQIALTAQLQLALLFKPVQHHGHKRAAHAITVDFCD
jgi:hypothetical protein